MVGRVIMLHVPYPSLGCTAISSAEEHVEKVQGREPALRDKEMVVAFTELGAGHLGVSV
jgi:hypothetical protein